MAVSTATFPGERAQFQSGIQGHHLGQDLQHVLGHRLVIYRDQILGLRVDLERLVEGQRCLDVVCCDSESISIPLGKLATAGGCTYPRRRESRPWQLGP